MPYTQTSSVTSSVQHAIMFFSMVSLLDDTAVLESFIGQFTFQSTKFSFSTCFFGRISPPS